MKNKVKNKLPDFTKAAIHIDKESLSSYADNAMRIYGQKTNEDRSIPDVYDGCKPVQRRILQSMKLLGLRHSAPYVKAARVVGDVLGRFHPHGDSAAFQASVTMANSSTPLIDGSGNWGNDLSGDEAAAMRYVECRMSKYAEYTFFDPRLLAVSPTVPNYDNKEREIYILPARLPNALINGNSGIGVGITTDTPSFSAPSVINVLREVVSSWSAKDKSSALTNQTLRKLLKFHYPQYGAQAYLKDEYLQDYKELVKSGAGQIFFGPVEEIDKSSSTVIIDSFGPGLNLSKALAELREKEWYVKLDDQTNIDNGKLPRYLITVKKTTSFKDISDELFDLFGSTKNYKVNLTVRRLKNEGSENQEEYIEMRRYPLVRFFNEWVDRRIELEKKALKVEITNNKRDQRMCIVRILASDKLDAIVKILKSGKDFAGMALALTKVIKVNLEEAEYILRMQVYRLSKLDKDQEQKKLNGLKQDLKTLEGFLARPTQALLKDLDRLVKELGV